MFPIRRPLLYAVRSQILQLSAHLSSVHQTGSTRLLTTTAVNHRFGGNSKNRHKDATSVMFDSFERNLKKINVDGTASDEYIPTMETLSVLFEGRRYDTLPAVFIKATKNNTLVHVFTHSGEPIAFASCGTEGFKNARKSTNAAAQAAGIGAATKALQKGCFPYVRIIVKGLGVGRLESILGMQIAGMKIASITDRTTTQTKLRPKKVRRI